ncbi:tetratricopeptide repeat protein [Ideonella sp. A 288]|uniref:tetratricopeptide repeat protein n=1 Tax=Ideonella sp. A 288 TaxID=1962181 RepID=UPI001184E40D|nr:tetratricopeptide repeat protein [Ideonella sp. A 288]
MPEALLTAFLAAHRNGALAALLQQRPRLVRRCAHRLLPPLWRVGGDAVPPDADAPLAWQLLLRALLAELRPDGQVGLGGIDEALWLQPTPDWRALLALASHQGLLEVPSLPAHYRAQPTDAPADRLCGLWDVAPSTFYRSVDRGRRLLAQALARPLHGPGLLKRQRALQDEVHALLGHGGADARVAWHRRQAARAMSAQDGVAALWHALHAADAAGFIVCLQRFAVPLARHPDTDILLHEAAALPADPAQQVQLALAEAALWRVRGDAPAECQACERALRLAHTAGDALLLGRAFGALGRHHEVRDPDRAFACFQDSADHLREAGVPDTAAPADGALLDECSNTLVRLAWWYLLHNDPRAGPLLERAQALHDHSPRALEAQALLAQTWGEYWRRSGQLSRALEHKYRALHLYQRLGDQQGLLKTHGNLALIHGEAKDFARAIECSKHVLEMAEHFAVEPETVAATHLNLGAAYFWQSRWDAAIAHYEQTLQLAGRAQLGVLVWRAHYNLAEAYYKRFQALDRADDELQGDAHTAAALAAWPAQGDAAPAEAARRLKRDILGPRDDDNLDRLLPGEFAAHFPELLAVQRQRAALALPLPPEEQVAAHLAIARAYLAVSVKEREAAVALIERHGLGDRFNAEFGQLQQTFAHAQSRQQRLAERWRQQAGDLLAAPARAALLTHLLTDGALSKSLCAPLCGVGLATASKLLGQLAARGLLVQEGRGPSTRYQLPEDA